MEAPHRARRIQVLATIGLIAAAIGLFAIVSYVNRPRTTPQGPSTNAQQSAHGTQVAIDSDSPQVESPLDYGPPRLIARTDHEAEPKTYVDENGKTWTLDDAPDTWSSPEARAEILKAVGLTDGDPTPDDIVLFPDNPIGTDSSDGSSTVIYIGPHGKRMAGTTPVKTFVIHDPDRDARQFHFGIAVHKYGKWQPYEIYGAPGKTSLFPDQAK